MTRVVEVRADDEGQQLTLVRVDAPGRRNGEALVEHIEEQWRLAEAWWREPAQARTYYRAVLEGGRLLTVYHDDVTGDWHEQPYTEPHTS
jgi:hypothetical protein